MEFQYINNNIPPDRSFVVQLNREFSVIHVHSNFELNLVTSGRGKRIVGNNISDFEDGDLILVGPDMPHGHEFDHAGRATHTECLALIISEKLISGSINSCRELEPIKHLFQRALKGVVFKGIDVPEITTRLRALDRVEGFDSFVCLLSFLNALTGIGTQEIISLTPELPVSSYKDLDHIKTVYDFVSRNLQNSINLDTAASLLNMAPGSFCRFFKKRTGKSFLQYVKDVRISHACNLLSNTELPIAQVCFESGYGNLANFNFYFKSIMKLTPSQYRKNFR